MDEGSRHFLAMSLVGALVVAAACAKKEEGPRPVPTYADGEIARMAVTGERVQILAALNCQPGAAACLNYTVRIRGKLDTIYGVELTKDQQ